MLLRDIKIIYAFILCMPTSGVTRTFQREEPIIKIHAMKHVLAPLFIDTNYRS